MIHQVTESPPQQKETISLTTDLSNRTVLMKDLIVSSASSVSPTTESTIAIITASSNLQNQQPYHDQEDDFLPSSLTINNHYKQQQPPPQQQQINYGQTQLISTSSINHHHLNDVPNTKSVLPLHHHPFHDVDS